VLGILALSIGASLIWPAPMAGPQFARPEGKTGSIFGGLRRSSRSSAP